MPHPIRAKSRTPSSGYIQSVDRALSILELFSNERPEIGVSDIARLLHLNKSTAFGLLSTLERRGYVEQNPDNGRYRLGLKTIELGQQKLSAFNVSQIAHPILKTLVDKVGETAHLAIYDRGEVSTSTRWVHNRSHRLVIGNETRLCTGVGKCLLAFQSEEEVERALSGVLDVRTPKTITDRKRLQGELETIRKSDMAHDDEEFSLGLFCFAAPVRDMRGAVCAGVSISIPTIRMDPAKKSFFEDSVSASARAISEALGYNRQ
jgi:DNA-binding IclR family transcriptional regulator